MPPSRPQSALASRSRSGQRGAGSGAAAARGLQKNAESRRAASSAVTKGTQSHAAVDDLPYIKPPTDHQHVAAPRTGRTPRGPPPPQKQVVSVKPPAFLGKASASVDVLGDHGLSLDELRLVMQLRETSMSQRVTLRNISESLAECKTLVMSPQGGRGRSRLPTLILLGSKAVIEEHVDGLRAGVRLFGDLCPTVVQSVFAVEVGVLQLRLHGSRCCLPDYVTECSTLKLLSHTVNVVMKGGEDVMRHGHAALCATNQLFAILGRPRSRLVFEEVNFFDTFCDIGAVVLGRGAGEGQTGFGPRYFDGLGATNEVETTYGTLTSDGVRASDIDHLVSIVVGKPQKPSVFFEDFHQRMRETLPSWKLPCACCDRLGNLHFHQVLHDGDGCVWILEGVQTTCGKRHVLADLAWWLASALFLHAHIETPKDTKHLRELILTLASIPEGLKADLAAAPAEASVHVNFLWTFVQLICRHLRERVDDVIAAAAGTPGGTGFERSAHLQFIWLLLDSSVKMVVSRMNASAAELKRLALFAALAFANRLSAATGRVPDPRWFAERRFAWKSVDEQHAAAVPLASSGATVANTVLTFDCGHQSSRWLRASMGIRCLASLNAWTTDTATLEMHSSLEDNFLVKVAGCQDDTKRWMPADMRLDLLQRHRVFVTGGPGSGKTTLLRAVIADFAQEMLGRGVVDVMPTWVPCGSLAKIVNAEDGMPPDVLQEFFRQASAGDDELAERYLWNHVEESPPWPSRSQHCVVAVQSAVDDASGESQEELLVLGGCGLDGRPLQDAWASCDGGRSWRELPRPPWPARYGHQAVLFQKRIIVIGGMGDEERRLRDVWESSDGGNTWNELPVPKWSARVGHQAVVLPLTTGQNPIVDHIVLLGGNGQGNQIFRDVWASSTGGFTWQQLEAPPWPPRFNFRAIGVIDAAGTGGIDGLYVIGGVGDGKLKLADVWRMTGSCWPLFSSSSSAASGHLKPGGDATNGGQGSTDRCRWDLLTKEPKWRARSNHEVVIHRGKFVLFGGVGEGSGTADLCDAWASTDGKTWQELPRACWRSVALRCGHRALKTEKGHVVVLGGFAMEVPSSEDVPGFMRKRKSAIAIMTNVVNSRAVVAIVLSRTMLLAIDDFDDSSGLGLSTLQQVWECVDQLAQFEPFHFIIAAGRPSALLDKIGERQLLLAASGSGSPVADLADDNTAISSQSYEASGSASIVQHFSEVALQPFDEEHLRGLAERCLGSLAQLERPRFDVIQRCLLQVGCRDLVERPALAMLVLAWHLRGRERSLFSGATSNASSGVAAVQLSASIAPPGTSTASGTAAGSRLQQQRTPRTVSFASRQLHVPTPRQVYELIFAHCLQGSLQIHDLHGCGGDEHDDDYAGFRRLQELGIDAIVADLAYEMHTRGNYCLNEKLLAQVRSSRGSAWSSEAWDAFSGILRSGAQATCLLFAQSWDGSVQFQQASMQDFLAARHLWKRLDSGEDLPQWILRELQGSEFSIGCGRFFCAIAAGRQPLALKRFGALRDGLGCILRNMARAGDDHAVRCLLEVVPDRQVLLLTSSDFASPGMTPLHLAALYGHCAVANTILRLAPKPESLDVVMDADGLTPLHVAAQHGHEATVRALLENRGDRWGLLITVDRSSQRVIPLHLAAKNGHEAAAKAMLELSPSADALNLVADYSGCTALHFAAQYGRDHVAGTLLHGAANTMLLLTTENVHDKRTALHLASDVGSANVVKVILELVAEEDANRMLTSMDALGQTALHLASAKGHVATLRTLLRLAPDPGSLLSSRDRLTGQTPLHFAADAGHGDAVAALLEVVAVQAPLATYAVDKRGRYTALHLAAERGKVDACRELLARAPDPTRLLGMCERYSGQTALHLAASAGHPAVVRALLEAVPANAERGHLMSAVDGSAGFTALHLAAERGHCGVVEALLECAPDSGAKLIKIGVTRWCNFTPLHLAAYKGHEDAVGMLLQLAPDRRAALAAMDCKRRTPAQLAMDRGYSAVATCLSQV